MSARASILAIPLLLLLHVASLAETPAVPPPTSPGPDSDLALDYCRSFGTAAVDARKLRQERELQKMQAELEEKLAIVKAESERLEALLAKHDAIMDAASKDVVKIYAAAEPAAAARQLEKTEPWVSATILRRLPAKLAGEILSIMDTGKAANLIAVMTNQNMRPKAREE
jgi:flagellar motility protein MotE (MotC chaperone)